MRRAGASAEDGIRFRFKQQYTPVRSRFLSMGDLYATYHDDDGFLYLAYSGENTFGGLRSGTSVPLQT
ncbi:hypothetical protein HPB52_008517 [Rhipicephalus sanguineus]|uniref:Uncharacterized protein n=1 Tax=Rhipicephalus sanguineus TaxID=34632 RepID=A0A9D4T7J2_RHISA|nr:hypothetical protein HPB52_008517 [Rhipicephalus sanguineus]